MSKVLNILVVSRKKEVIDGVARVLDSLPDANVQQRLATNGHVDPLHGVTSLPHVLILHLGAMWREELAAVATRPADRRPALIVLGPVQDTQIVRAAMQAGARDLLAWPLVGLDLREAVERIEVERQASIAREHGSISAFINAKGGCGATFLACNVAHVLAVRSKRRVALIDLDLQFGTAPLYLDLFPKRGIHQALQNLDALDELALQGYMTRHASGLHVLGQSDEDPLSIQDPRPEHVQRVLELAAAAHQHVVVDLPRRLDPLAASVVTHAQHVAVVVQQSVTTLRDAGRLVRGLRAELGVSKECIEIVVNRYERKAPIAIEDIRSTLGFEEVTVVPNDFDVVSECINTGATLLDHARSAAVTRAVMALETRLGGSSAASKQSILARTFASLRN